MSFGPTAFLSSSAYCSYYFLLTHSFYVCFLFWLYLPFCSWVFYIGKLLIKLLPYVPDFVFSVSTYPFASFTIFILYTSCDSSLFCFDSLISFRCPSFSSKLLYMSLYATTFAFVTALFASLFALLNALIVSSSYSDLCPFSSLISL